MNSNIHDEIRDIVIKWLKKANFMNIDIKKDMSPLGIHRYFPDVYAVKNEIEYLFEIVTSHLNFPSAFNCIKKSNIRLFLVFPNEDFIENKKIDFFEVKYSKSLLANILSSIPNPRLSFLKKGLIPFKKEKEYFNHI